MKQAIFTDIDLINKPKGKINGEIIKSLLTKDSLKSFNKADIAYYRHGDLFTILKKRIR